MTKTQLKKATKKQLLKYVSEAMLGLNYGVYRDLPVETLRGCCLREAERQEFLAANLKRPSLGAILVGAIDRGATQEEVTELRIAEMKRRYPDAFAVSDDDQEFLGSMGIKQ